MTSPLLPYHFLDSPVGGWFQELGKSLQLPSGLKAQRTQILSPPLFFFFFWKPNPRTLTAGNDLLVPPCCFSQALLPLGEPEILTPASRAPLGKASFDRHQTCPHCMPGTSAEPKLTAPSPRIFLLPKSLSVTER